MNTEISLYLGLEVFHQVPLQIVLLLMATTATATTGGLETLFKQDSMFGIPMDPETILTLSVIWSMKTCVNLHLKAIKVHKGVFRMTTKLVVWTWGLFGTLRRMLSMVIYFVPFLGLNNVLYHWRAEQIPFGRRCERETFLFFTSPRY